MTKELSGVFKEWVFTRSNTIAFIRDLKDEGLNTKLNRPELDTFKKHFLEMINVQEAYSMAIKTGTMSFEEVRGNDEFTENITMDELLASIEKVDEDMKEYLEKSVFDAEIHWEDEKKTLTSHLAALISHEMFHLGQLVAFCYVQNIKLPKYIVMLWGLSAQDIN